MALFPSFRLLKAEGLQDPIGASLPLALIHTWHRKLLLVFQDPTGFCLDLDPFQCFQGVIFHRVSRVNSYDLKAVAVPFLKVIPRVSCYTASVTSNGLLKLRAVTVCDETKVRLGRSYFFLHYRKIKLCLYLGGGE